MVGLPAGSLRTIANSGWKMLGSVPMGSAMLAACIGTIGAFATRLGATLDEVLSCTRRHRALPSVLTDADDEWTSALAPGPPRPRTELAMKTS